MLYELLKTIDLYLLTTHVLHDLKQRFFAIFL